MTSPSFGCNLSRLAGSVQPGAKLSRRGLGSSECTLRPRRKQLLTALRHVAADTEPIITSPAESRAGRLHSGHHESRSCRVLWETKRVSSSTSWRRETEHRYGRTGMAHLVPKELLAKRWLCQFAPSLINGSFPEVNTHQPGH